MNKVTESPKVQQARQGKLGDFGGTHRWTRRHAIDCMLDQTPLPRVPVGHSNAQDTPWGKYIANVLWQRAANRVESNSRPCLLRVLYSA